MAQTRTRVRKTSQGDWRWWLWGDAYDDTLGGYESEKEARAELAKALREHEKMAERDYEERQFWRDAGVLA